MGVTSYIAPGLVRRQDNFDVRMMLCTAGHVDHGKTRLVGLLTGCATDRLKEEKERGLTIELGFAPCMIGDGLCVGVVDVPGHEKFVKTMVAGVSGIDMAILVIAADDGVMPQTIEHLQIMALLGVEQGIVVITKIDLVTPDRVDEVRVQIRGLVEGTFMQDAPVWPVSSETGEGIFEFFDALKAQIQSLARQKKSGVFRMPVERTFAQKGFGSVVTGIPLAGTVNVGDQVELVPGGVPGRVRGIQRFLRNAEAGSFGQCLALNIPEFSKVEVVRGQVICEPGYLREASMVHVQLVTVATIDPPLRNAEVVKVHTGTSESSATIYLLERPSLSSGETGLATLVLQHPVAAAAHDRFILRRPSPASTVGGGEILEVQCEGARPRKKALATRLADYLGCLETLPRSDPAFDRARVRYCLRATLPDGGGADLIAHRLLLPVGNVNEHLAALVAEEGIVELEPNYFVDAANFARRLHQAEDRATALEKNAQALALTVTDFQRGLAWPHPVWRHVLRTLEARGRIAFRENKLLLKGAVRDLPTQEQTLVEAIVQLYEQTGFSSPRPDELAPQLHAAPEKIRKLLDLLYHDGRLVRLSSSVVLSRRHFQEAQATAVRVIQQSGALDSADFKTHIGSTRKYALAVLDYLDAQKVTVRAGNVRRLAANYEARLR